MTRTLRTLLLSAIALGALATAAAATPSLPTGSAHMRGMHVASMHPGTAEMAGMHVAGMGNPAGHEAMLGDPTMQAHMAEYGIDLDAMLADCPMLEGNAMETMHGHGGVHLDHHRRAPGGDRR